MTTRNGLMKTQNAIETISLTEQFARQNNEWITIMLGKNHLR